MVDQHGLISMQLEAKLKEKIDVPLTEKVQFTQEQENFHRYTCTHVKLYIVFFIYSLPPSRVCVKLFIGFATIMAYGSTPYVGMAPKKMAATLKVHK